MSPLLCVFNFKQITQNDQTSLRPARLQERSTITVETRKIGPRPKGIREAGKLQSNVLLNPQVLVSYEFSV